MGTLRSALLFLFVSASFWTCLNHRKHHHQDQDPFRHSSGRSTFCHHRWSSLSVCVGGYATRHFIFNPFLVLFCRFFSPINMLRGVCKLAGLMLLRCTVSLTNQRGRCRRSLGFHTGACILIGCLLLGGLDKCCGLAAGRLSQWCGCAHQTGGGRVYRSSCTHQHCRKTHSMTLCRAAQVQLHCQDKCRVLILMPPLLNFALTLLAVSLCGRHYSGSRRRDGDSCWGNHWSNAGTGCSLAARGGARLAARRWSTWGGPDVGSGRLGQAGAVEETITSCC